MALIWFLVPVGAPRPAPQGKRDPEWIRSGPVASLTAARRQLLVGDFERYIQEKSAGQTLQDLAQFDHPQLSTLAREFGFELYEKQRALGTSIAHTIIKSMQAIPVGCPAVA